MYFLLCSEGTKVANLSIDLNGFIIEVKKAFQWVTLLRLFLAGKAYSGAREGDIVQLGRLRIAGNPGDKQIRSNILA